MSKTQIPGWINDWVPDGDTLSADPVANAALIRANQLRRLLVARYGAPDTMLVPLAERGGKEILAALLFDPAGREARAGGAGRREGEERTPGDREARPGR